MATYKVDALILKKKNYKEADRIITIFSRGVGKADVRAKGVRRSQSRLAGHLETFSYVSLLLAEGHVFDIVTQAQLYEGFSKIRTELPRMAEAFSAFELLDTVTPRGYKDSALFDFVLEYMRELEHVSEVRIPALRQSFEIKLIDMMGLLPPMTTCSVCEERFQGGEVFFDTASLQFLHHQHISSASRGWPISFDALKVFRFFQSHAFSEVQKLMMSAELHKEVDRVIGVLLQNVSEKRIHSPKIFQTRK